MKRYLNMNKFVNGKKNNGTINSTFCVALNFVDSANILKP